MLICAADLFIRVNMVILPVVKSTTCLLSTEVCTLRKGWKLPTSSAAMAEERAVVLWAAEALLFESEANLVDLLSICSCNRSSKIFSYFLGGGGGGGGGGGLGGGGTGFGSGGQLSVARFLPSLMRCQPIELENLVCPALHTFRIVWGVRRR